MNVVRLLLLDEFVYTIQLRLEVQTIVYEVLQLRPFARLKSVLRDELGSHLAQEGFVLLSLSHLAFDDGKADTVRVATTDTMRIDGLVLEAELHLAFVRELLHLLQYRIEDITMEGSILDVTVLDDALVVLAEGKHAEELLQVDVIDGTRAYLAPCTQIDIESRRARTAAKLGDALQVTGVALAEVQNLASTLVHHRNLDDTLPSLPTLVSDLLASSIYLRLRKLNLVEDVLADIIFYALVLVVTLVGHVHIQQGIARYLQLVVLLRTDAQVAKRNLEVEQIAR